MTYPREDDKSLQRHLSGITDEWCLAICDSTFLPPGAPALKEMLGHSLYQLAELLWSEPFSPETARDLGAEHARIRTISSDVLGQSLELLSVRLPSLDHLHPIPNLTQRIAVILGQFTNGYQKQSQRTILLEQEEIQLAYNQAFLDLQDRLRQSEEKYRTLVESAAEAIYIIDPEGVIHYMNKSSLELTGISESEIPCEIWDVLPRDLADAHLASVRKVVANVQPISEEVRVLVRGKYQWRESNLQPLRDNAGVVDKVLGISKDISSRKQAEADIFRYSKRLQLMRQMDQNFQANRSLDSILNSTLSYIPRLLPATLAAVEFFDLEANTITVHAGIPRESGFADFMPITNWERIEALKRGDTFVSELSSATQSKELRSQLESLGTRELLSVPLQAKTELIGALTIIADGASFEAEDIEIALEIASTLAIAAQNALLMEAESRSRQENQRLIKQIQQHAVDLETRVFERTRELSSLYDVTATASRYLELQTILELVLAKTLTALGCRAGAIQLPSQASASFDIIASTGISSEIEAFLEAQTVHGDIIGRVFRTGEPRSVIDPADIVGFLKSTRLDQFRGFIAVPMRTGGKPLGVLSVYGIPDKSLEDEQLALLVSIADHISVAIENDRLRKTAERLAVMEERERLARELHDSVSQALYSLTLFAEAAQERERDGKLDLVRKHLDDIDETAHQALKEMRLMLYELRSSTRVKEGLVETLRHRLDAVEGRAGVKTKLTLDLDVALDPELEETLYFIAQEGLNNALKHANASSIEVEIRKSSDMIEMKIMDDGDGFDVNLAAKRGGMGLGIMRERAKRADASITIRSEPGQGTIIHVQSK